MLHALGKRYQFDSYFYFLSLIAVLSVFVISFYSPENRLYYGFDSTFHLARIEALVESLKDGRFPVYIDYGRLYGLGYGVKLFYSDFTLLPVALLSLVFDLAISFKIYLFFILVLSGHFTYQALSRFFKSRYICSFASLLITFSYFKLHSLFHRAGLGEVLAYVFIPVVVIGVYEMIYGNPRKWYYFTVGYALLIMSHLISSLLVAIFLLPVFLIHIRVFFKEKERLYYLLISSVTILVLSAYGLFPLLEQLSSSKFFLNNQGWVSLAQMKLSIAQLFRGFFVCFTDEDLGLGEIMLLLLFSRFFVRRSADRKLVKVGDFCLLMGFILLFLTSELMPWGRIYTGMLEFMQFPWRLFGYIVFFWSVSIAINFYILFKTKKLRLYSFLSVVILHFVFIGFYANNYRKVEGSEFFKGVMGLVSSGIGAAEYLPLRLQSGSPSYWYLFKEGHRLEIKASHADTEIRNFERSKSEVRFSVDTWGRTDSIEIPLLYYKGYSASFNKKSIPVSQSSHGLVETTVNGRGEVIVDFTGTFIQRYSFYVSVFGFLMVLFYAYYPIERKKRQ